MALEMKTVFLAVFLNVFVSQCSAACMLIQPQPNADHCVHDGHVLALGESFIDFEKCTEYRCQKDGSMSVCGIGINGGILAVPEGCTIIKGEKCSFSLVDSNDHSIQCRFGLLG